MSEVKPTLAITPDREEIPLNAWLSTFFSGKWIDTPNRFWVQLNAQNMPSAYEYKIKFDTFTNNFTTIFPFVVKTSDSKVNEVFINGVKYQARGKENYGDRFVVSGLEFNFRVASKLKLRKRVHPILTYNFTHGFFVSTNFLAPDYIRLRYYLSILQTVYSIQTDYIVVRTPYNTKTFVLFGIRSWDAFSGVWRTHETWMSQTISTVYWDMFLGVWETCETWMPQPVLTYKTANSLSNNYYMIRNISGEFINTNSLSYEDTSWDRFGGMWITWETWMP
jgi:hypothetical protein